jgi:hypothetical protein
MQINIKIPSSLFSRLGSFFARQKVETIIAICAVIAATLATAYYYSIDAIIAYGDSESHLNIAKRIVHSITPGMAQAGGIWLPIPHLLMVPLVAIEPLYRTGLAGSIVSGIAYVLSCVFLYKTAYFLTKRKIAGIVASIVFGLNPNILYMQSTPMTELVLIVFFILSGYYFIRFISDQENISLLILAAFFGFCATLSRYDGWFLVMFEAMVLGLLYIPQRKMWAKLQGLVVLYGSLAFVGILMWFAWGYMILGDPLYFTNSQFSAKSQQNNWLARGELPAYHNVVEAAKYYIVTSWSNTGVIIFLIAVVGFILFLFQRQYKYRFFIALVLLVPFIFNILTMFLGQSVIFIPSLTPVSFEWRLFNVRYGLLMLPFVSIFAGYLFLRAKQMGKMVLVGLFVFQNLLFAVGYSRVLTLDDGVVGLSHAKRPDAEGWMKDNYDSGLVLIDDYARTISVVRSQIPMQNIIYIGNKPYWEESLKEPEKYAEWIVMQKDDSVWNAVYDDPIVQGRLFKYFNKVYTSDEILIFKRIPTPSQIENN